MNLVEMITEDGEQHVSPCRYGNIVDGHACYCHNQYADMRKCPIWRRFGEHDLTRWLTKGDWNKDDWDGGCKFFEPSKKYF